MQGFYLGFREQRTRQPRCQRSPAPHFPICLHSQAPGSAQVAGLCGRLTLHRDLRTGRWEPDPQRSRRCLLDPQRVLEYCRQVGGTHGERRGQRESGSKLGPCRRS